MTCGSPFRSFHDFEQAHWLLGKFNGGRHEGEMLRVLLYRSCSSLITFSGLLERRLNALRVLFLYTSSVELRSIENKVKNRNVNT